MPADTRSTKPTGRNQVKVVEIVTDVFSSATLGLLLQVTGAGIAKGEPAISPASDATEVNREFIFWISAESLPVPLGCKALNRAPS